MNEILLRFDIQMTFFKYPVPLRLKGHLTLKEKNWFSFVILDKWLFSFEEIHFTNMHPVYNYILCLCVLLATKNHLYVKIFDLLQIKYWTFHNTLHQ